MKKHIIAAVAVATTITSAYGASTMTAIPAQSTTVTDYYKQSVYDPKQTKIGDVASQRDNLG